MHEAVCVLFQLARFIPPLRDGREDLDPSFKRALFLLSVPLSVGFASSSFLLGSDEASVIPQGWGGRWREGERGREKEEAFEEERIPKPEGEGRGRVKNSAKPAQKSLRGGEKDGVRSFVLSPNL